MKSAKNRVSCVLATVCALGLLAADQWTKFWISAHMTLAESRPFLPGFLDLTLVHNKGGAWGMLSGYTWILLAITVVIMMICIAMLLKNGLKSRLMFWALTLILSGGVGNLLDRLFRHGCVVDFLHFQFMPEFPVFNLADCGVVLGCGLLILYFILDAVRSSRAAANKPDPAALTLDELLEAANLPEQSEPPAQSEPAESAEPTEPPEPPCEPKP